MIDIQKEIEKKFPNINKKENFLKKSLFKVAKKIVHEDSINQFLSQNEHLKGFEFVDAVLVAAKEFNLAMIPQNTSASDHIKFVSCKRSFFLS